MSLHVLYFSPWSFPIVRIETLIFSMKTNYTNRLNLRWCPNFWWHVLKVIKLCYKNQFISKFVTGNKRKLLFKTKTSVKWALKVTIQKISWLFSWTVSEKKSCQITKRVTGYNLLKSEALDVLFASSINTAEGKWAVKNKSSHTLF